MYCKQRSHFFRPPALSTPQSVQGVVRGLAEPRDGPPQRATVKGRAARSAHIPDCERVCASVCLCGCMRVLQGSRTGWALARKPGGLGSRIEWDTYPRGTHSDFHPLSPLFPGWKAGEILLQPTGQVPKGVVVVTHPAPCSPSACTPFPQDRVGSLLPANTPYATHTHTRDTYPSGAKIRDGEWLLSQIGTRGIHKCETKSTRPILTSASQSPL